MNMLFNKDMNRHLTAAKSPEAKSKGMSDTCNSAVCRRLEKDGIID